MFFYLLLEVKLFQFLNSIENLFALHSLTNIFQIIKTTMKYHRKLQLIRQLSKKIRTVQLNKILVNQQNQYLSSFQPDAYNGHKNIGQNQQEFFDKNQGQKQDQELAGDDFNVLDYISSLPIKLRQEFRRNNPDLPDIFFMNKKQKERYFGSINEKFKNKLAKTPQRKSKTKKILKFKNDFEVKPFNQAQKVVAVSQAKQIYQSYKSNIHFS